MAAGSPVSMRNGRAASGRPGTVTQAAAFPNIGGAPSQANFNDLLQRLRDAGVIAT